MGFGENTKRPFLHPKIIRKMTRQEKFADEIVCIEGGYSDNPNDTGGKTMYGVTEATARRNGYTGDMKNLTPQQAKTIFINEYYLQPGFDKIQSDAIAFELFDTSVNGGQARSVMILQDAYNLLNVNNRYGDDLKVDGVLGNVTAGRINAYPYPDRLVMLQNAVQAAFYIDIAKRKPSQREFIYGWLKNRVFSQLKA